MIVVNCERSPHSAKKVRVNACKNILESTINAERLVVFLIIPLSGSWTNVVDVSFSY